MSRSCCNFFGAVLAATAITAVVFADPPLQLAPQKGVLLLRGGQVLAGTITPAGDHYLVSLEHGEIRVPSGKVEKLCKSLEEVYEHKRSQVELGKAAEHVALADWCLQNGLFELADCELSYALAADVNYPRIRLMERRLKLARRGAEPAAPHVKPAEQGPTNDELDRMVRGMSGAAVEQFTSTVQPLLVNTCTTAGCHLPHSDAKLQLMRIPANSLPSRRTTQRNLFSVWRQIDPANPASSPLLTVPLKQHGGARAAIFSDHEAEQYRLLASWVGELARAPKAAQPASVDKPASTLLQTRPPEPAGRTAEPGAAAGRNERPQSVKASKPSSEIDLVSFDDAAENQGKPSGKLPSAPAKPKKNAEPGPLESDYAPVDPFDPEIFNRRYHPRDSESK